MTDSKALVAEAAANLARINLARIDAELCEAEQDRALLTRLESARDRVSRLTSEKMKAGEAYQAALAAQQTAANDAQFNDLGDIEVTDATPDEGVLRSSFNVKYTCVAYDIDSGESVPQAYSCTGFGSLPNKVLAYLIERHPDRIPTKIMDLAPGEPATAFERYFRGLSRGFIAA